jgi:anti-sigma factor RsiW
MTCDSPGHRHCLELFEKLSEYIDQELAPEAHRDIEAHVAECLACFACLQTLKQTIALCRQAGDQPVPAAFSRKLHAMLQTATRPPLP